MDKNKTYVVHIKKEEHAMLKVYCVKEGLVMKQLMSKIIRNFMKDK